MVAHIDAKSGTAFLVSFPRDLWVAIPGLGHAKINAAFNAGPQRVIETIESDFDVPISHYLEVDFQGFRKMVNAIGTIPIYFPTPARDIKTGLAINKAGCQQLNGDAGARVRAVALLRVARQREVAAGPDLRPRSHQPPAVLPAHARAADARTRRPRSRGRRAACSTRCCRTSNATRSWACRRCAALAYAFHRPGGVETVTLPVNRQFFDGQDALALDDAKAAPILARLRGIGGPVGRLPVRSKRSTRTRSTWRSRTGPGRPGSAPAPTTR